MIHEAFGVTNPGKAMPAAPSGNAEFTRSDPPHDDAHRFAEEVSAVANPPSDGHRSGSPWIADAGALFADVSARMEHRLAEFRTREKTLERVGVSRTDRRWQEISDERGAFLTAMQLEVHAIATRVELFGKFVEHTTAAIRNTSQMQV